MYLFKICSQCQGNDHLNLQHINYFTQRDGQNDIGVFKNLWFKKNLVALKKRENSSAETQGDWMFCYTTVTDIIIIACQ